MPSPVPGTVSKENRTLVLPDGNTESISTCCGKCYTRGMYTHRGAQGTDLSLPSGPWQLLKGVRGTRAGKREDVPGRGIIYAKIWRCEIIWWTGQEANQSDLSYQ